MQTLKKLCVVLLSLGLLTGLVSLAGSVAINRVFNNVDVLKQTASDSGIYNSGANAIVEEGIKQAEGQTDVPLNDPAVRKAIDEVVTPDLVQKNSEQVLDSVYEWAAGGSSQPDFSIDVQDVKNQIAESVSQAGKARVEKLPTCTFTQMQQLNPETINPFTIPCRPVGVNLEALRQKYEQQIARSDAFLTDPTITASDIKDDSGQPVFPAEGSQTDGLGSLMAFPIVAAVVSLGCALGIILLQPTKRSGVKIVAILLIVSGVLIATGAFLTNGLFSNLQPDFGESETAALQNSSLFILRSLSNIVNQVLYVIAVIYVVAGGSGLIFTRITGKPRNRTGSRKTTGKAV